MCLYGEYGVCVHMSVGVSAEAIGHSEPYSSEVGSLTESGVQVCLRPMFSCCCFFFSFMVSGDLNSGSHSHVASDLPIPLSLQVRMPISPCFDPW